MCYNGSENGRGGTENEKALAVCLTALVCWVCAGYAEETRVGDTVMFGQYEQDGNLDNGSEPIAWQVLDVQGGKALLMSRYALDCLPFHDEKTDAVWNQSALNAWLQADFHAAFTDAEWAAIAPVTLADTAADGNPEWQNTDAEPAETHVFLLSYAQVMQYLPEQEQRKVSGTEYARSRGAKFLGFTTIGIGETDWWLRSPGKESYDACFLDVRGAVGTKCVTEKLGVRPALWMNLSADRNAFPYEQQVQAKQFAEQGDYAEATALLDTLGDYAGSAALAKEYRYQQAQAEAASGNYDAAIALYTELAGYADSDALCRASRYEKAVAAQETGDYAGAMALFADAGQYADSMARLRECCKQQGISIYYFSADAVNAGVDTGYAKQDTISGDDKHFGWRLGRFFLTGFTRVTADENQQPVFIKTLGDSVTLWFDLEQDIDALNGNAQLSLAADANGYDQQFGIPKTNFGRGTLIVRHTDYQNAKNEPVVYTDYLLAKGTTGANTRIVLHEEGDYEVALDYEVQDSELTHITSKFGNYRIFLRFSIRNGNCMVYPFDLLTGAELQNTSVAEAGFSLDLARSRYLDINVRRAVLVETANGVIEDERFNRPAKDGDRYTQEGIYTISVSNRYTGESTTKTIFVGSQELLETYVRNGFSLERLRMRGMRMKKLCSLLLALVLLAGCALGESAPEFRRMGDAALLPYLENSLYEQLVSDLDSSDYFVENVQAVYISQEYLDELAFNSQENVYFGYTLSELNAQFQGEKYIFTLGENNETVAVPWTDYDDTYDRVIRNVAIGTGVILVCVTVSVVSAGVGAPAVSMIFAMAAKDSAVHGLLGAAKSGVPAFIATAVRTGDLQQAAREAALTGSEGFKWGAIGGSISGGVTEAVGLKGAMLNGLSMNEAAQIQRESGYPLDVIKGFRTMEQYEVCQKAGLVPKMVDGKMALIRQIDLDFVDEKGRTNLTRMQKGLAALDPATGEEYQLYYIIEKRESTIAILTKTEYMQSDSCEIWHTAAEMPQNDRWFFEKQHDDFWESMADLVEVIFPTDELLELPFAPQVPDSEEKPENIAQQ